MIKQYTLSFANTPNYSKDTYIISESDEELWRFINTMHLNTSPSNKSGLLIEGVSHSGKTHLCHVIKEHYPTVRVLNGRAHANGHPFDLNDQMIIVDDADKADQTWLFHLYNRIKECQGSLLMTFSQPYSHVFTLPDLCSRLATMNHFTLSLPDDQTMKDILNKRFTDLGLRVEQNVIDKIILYIERSYGALEKWALHINKRSAEERKKVTLKFITQLLDEEFHINSVAPNTSAITQK